MKTLHFYLFVLISTFLLNTGCSENKSKSKKPSETPKPIASPIITNKSALEQHSPSTTEKSHKAIIPPDNSNPSEPSPSHISGIASTRISGVSVSHNISGRQTHISGQRSPNISGSQLHVSGSMNQPRISGR